jgi:hypothetical protein
MKAVVVLDLSGTNDVQICTDGDAYISSISDPNNPNFREPAVSAPVAAMIAAQLQLTQTSIISLRAAIAAPMAPNKSDLVQMARASVDSNLSMLANLVENVANAPSVPDLAREAIVHSANMVLKAGKSRTKAVFSVSQNKESGSVHLVAEGNANAHLWEYTTDTVHFSNRLAAEPTTVANTNITGLKKLTSYAFFHKAIVPNQTNSWEGPVFLDVV